ncbi:MAG: helix-turn-helix transcriptional regulator, partial [Oscillospiraceae bacterium]|nr:helix-turn-helix transcriptional regulator [Oscillospiraceae bacterium]
GREAYYNVRFVLRSAAEELEIPVEGDREYAQNLLPGENIMSLEQQMDGLFRGLDARRQEDMDNFHNEILAWVRQNLADYDLGAPKVAERFGIPEKRVYEIVRRETGMTFREYLTDLRMQKAARLLRSTVEGISEIAQSCGYHSSSTFYRLFQECYGMSPGQYRKEKGES